ncbi:helix-turn-helix domain-containing protein [Leptospira venezuelensis]|uniref:helix-turn-helix domain-containing protein n=1 Tax=Leptospira venezuelensis TaxID=1958811 RepID=UPI001F374819|nr:helix-turn-helix domain-containing protein [Leptospira venezuelensis]
MTPCLILNIFPSMLSAPEEFIWGNPNPKELRILLPLAFPECLRLIDGLAGLATLISESDPSSLEEVGSWGYGEDGFFYPFLTRGSQIRTRLEGSKSPFFLHRSEEVELFRDDSRGCLLSPVLLDGKMFGFFLIELPDEAEERQILILHLLCQKVARLLKKESEPSLIYKLSEDVSPDPLGELIFRLGNGKNSQLEKFKDSGNICISGPASSGKKTLAKWIQKREFPGRPILTVSILPEQASKLEKALIDWEKMAESGTLILENSENYSMAQQRILFEYSQRKSGKSRLIFLENSGKKSIEEFLYFRSLLAENKLELPAWKDWTKLDKIAAIRPIFQEVCVLHGRPDLALSEEAIESLVGGNSCQNLEDLRNAIEEAVLNSGSGEIRNSDLKKEVSKGISLPDPEDLDLRKAVEAVERQKILLADKLFGGNQIRMAKALGISRGSLQYKLKNLGLG